MSEFKWTALRTRLLRKRVSAFNRTITNAAKALVESGNAGLVRFLPARKNIEEVRERIDTVNDFRRIVGYDSDEKRGRYSELNRILKRNNPNALTFTVSDKGRVITNYQNKELKYHKRRENFRRIKEVQNMNKSYFEGDQPINLDDMTEVEKMTAQVNNNLMPPDDGEIDRTLEDLDDSIYNQWDAEDASASDKNATAESYVELYLDIWQNPINHHMDMNGYQTLINAMNWMKDNHPDYILKMFKGGYDELEIAWIVDSGKTTTYDSIDYEVRHNRTVDFILDKAVRLGYNYR